MDGVGGLGLGGKRGGDDEDDEMGGGGDALAGVPGGFGGFVLSALMAG